MSKHQEPLSVKAYYDLLGAFTKKKYEFERGLIAAAEKDGYNEHHSHTESKNEALDKFLAALELKEEDRAKFKEELSIHYQRLKSREIEHGIEALASAATTYALFYCGERMFGHQVEHHAEKIIGHNNTNMVGQFVNDAHNIHTVNEVIEGSNHVVLESLKREEALQKIKKIAQKYNLDVEMSYKADVRKPPKKAAKQL